MTKTHPGAREVCSRPRWLLFLGARLWPRPEIGAAALPFPVPLPRADRLRTTGIQDVKETASSFKGVEPKGCLQPQHQTNLLGKGKRGKEVFNGSHFVESGCRGLAP